MRRYLDAYRSPAMLGRALFLFVIVALGTGSVLAGVLCVMMILGLAVPICARLERYQSGLNGS